MLKILANKSCFLSGLLTAKGTSYLDDPDGYSYRTSGPYAFRMFTLSGYGTTFQSVPHPLSFGGSPYFDDDVISHQMPFDTLWKANMNFERIIFADFCAGNLEKVWVDSL